MKKTLRDYLGQVLNIKPEQRKFYYFYVRDGRTTNKFLEDPGDMYAGKIINIDGNCFEVRKDNCASEEWINHIREFHDYELVPTEALDKYVGI